MYKYNCVTESENDTSFFGCTFCTPSFYLCAISRYVAVLKSEIDFDEEESSVVLDDEGNKTLVEGLLWKV